MPIPVPTAVPPRAKIDNSLRANSILLIEFFTCPRYPLNSCPSLIGVASCRCVLPVFTISQNSLDFFSRDDSKIFIEGIRSSLIDIAAAM